MKKKLSADALDILAVAAVSEWSMCADDLTGVADLFARGYIHAWGNGVRIILSPTTAGVNALLRAGVIVQNGTRFALADGFETTRKAEPEQVSQFRAPLRVVEPRAPDPFADGMNAAIRGDPMPDTYDADWMSGWKAGMDAKKQGIV